MYPGMQVIYEATVLRRRTAQSQSREAPADKRAVHLGDTHVCALQKSSVGNYNLSCD